MPLCTLSEIRYPPQGSAGEPADDPSRGARKTRFVSVPGRQDLPDGDYGFVELYCGEPVCVCRRVMINVLRPETGWSQVWAAISYGWESPDYYRQWSGAGNDPAESKGPYLGPLNPRTSYSPALLNLFRFLIQSPEHGARLQRHYQMFRESVDRTAVRGSIAPGAIRGQASPGGGRIGANAAITVR